MDLHRNFVNKASLQLKDDPRFMGMAIGGSWIDHKLDEYSDLDIYLIMVEDFNPKIEEKRAILEAFGKILCFYTNTNDENVTVSLFNFEPLLLHVDCKWIHLDGFRKRVENPTIIFEHGKLLSDCIDNYPSEGYELPDLNLNEMHFWTWVHYILSKIGRGEIFEAHGYLCEVRNYCLGPMILQKNGMSARRLRHLEKLPDDDLQKVLKTIPKKCNPKSCFDATLNLIETYKTLRDFLASNDFIANIEAENACINYAQHIKQILKNDKQRF
jgi:hypothetical protein